MTIHHFLIRAAAPVVIVFLVATGCSKHQPAAKAVPQVVIEPNVGVDEVQRGMNQQQVEAVLGKPEKINSHAWLYFKKGIYVAFSDSGVMFNIKCVSPFAGVTKEGIGIGSTRNDVVTAYGEPTQDQHFKHGDENLWFSSLGTSFYLQDGKVTSFIVHLDPP